MDAWVRKVAVITDCNNELGLCIIEELSRAGMVAVGFAKSDEIIKTVTDKIDAGTTATGKIFLCQCDVTDEKQLKAAFEKTIEMHGSIDVLINNADYNIDCNLSSGDIEDFRKLIDMNIYSLVACIRLAVGAMIEQRSRGHVINMNDLQAYYLPDSASNNVYIATKCAMTSINEILRQELRYLRANVKVTNIARGCTEGEGPASNKVKLKSSDVAKIVTSVLFTPEHLQIHELLVDSAQE